MPYCLFFPTRFGADNLPLLVNLVFDAGRREIPHRLFFPSRFGADSLPSLVDLVFDTGRREIPYCLFFPSRFGAISLSSHSPRFRRCRVGIPHQHPHFLRWHSVIPSFAPISTLAGGQPLLSLSLQRQQ